MSTNKTLIETGRSWKKPWLAIPEVYRNTLEHFVESQCESGAKWHHTLDGYVILDCVGAGTYGVVFQVRRNGTHYRMKVCAEDCLRYAEWWMRFILEFKAGYMVTSDFVGRTQAAVAKVRDCYLLVYLLGEWLEGNPPLPAHVCNDQARLMRIFHCMAQGVFDMHRDGHVHRDLKPDNFIFHETHGKWVDLGQVKFFGIDCLTGRGSSLGALQYRAPEGLTDAIRLGLPSDIFSLGVTFSYLATDQFPFDPGNQQKGSYNFTALGNSIVDNTMRDCITKMLHVEPDQRPDARTVCQRLEYSADRISASRACYA